MILLFDYSDKICYISFMGNTYHKIGDKAWINKFITLLENKKGLFVDI